MIDNPHAKICSKIIESNVSVTDNVVIIFENSKKQIFDCFYDILKSGYNIKNIQYFNFDDYGERPLAVLPKVIKKSLLDCNIAFVFKNKYSDDQYDEGITIKSEIVKIKKINPHLRLGILLSVDLDLFSHIFSYDPQEIKLLNKKIYDLITSSKITEVKIETPIGTNLICNFSAQYTLINQDADLSKPSAQHSLLAGEVYGYPISVNGIAVIDGTMGGKFMKYDMEKTPLTIMIKNSKISHFSCNDEALMIDFEKHLTKYKNSRRVGELGFGTNLSLTRFYNILGIDEKFPGNHIAFGHPYSEKTNADWTCKTHIDCVMKNCTTYVNNIKILHEGRYLL